MRRSGNLSLTASLQRLLPACWLLFGVGAAQAEGLVFGDWRVEGVGDRSALYAETLNDAGSRFREHCVFALKTCTWKLLVGTACMPAEAHPVLANTDLGAAQLEIVCEGPVEDHSYAYTFKDWKRLEKLLKSAAVVSFAIPLRAGEIRVEGFSLQGHSEATMAAEHAAADIIRRRPTTLR